MIGKVLIVEDEAITALMLRTEVTELGLEVIDVADTGKSAIASARRQRPDAILMDIRLKDEVDGIEAAKIINDNIPVIYHTAFVDAATRDRAMTTKPVDFLEKPATSTQIASSLAKALSRGSN
jgi:two-component system response regulator